MSTQPKLRGVLFDLFGTLVRPFSKRLHDDVFHGIIPWELGSIRERFIAAWNADYENRILGRSGRIAEQLRAIERSEKFELPPEIFNRIVSQYPRTCDHMMQPVWFARDVLERVSQHSLEIGLVSNAALDFADAFDRSPLRPYFRTCTFSCHTGVAKPDPSIYLTAAKALAVQPSEILFVGDGSDRELEGAAQAGMTPVLVETDYRDTYDAARPWLDAWFGIRVRDLSMIAQLVEGDDDTRRVFMRNANGTVDRKPVPTVKPECNR